MRVLGRLAVSVLTMTDHQLGELLTAGRPQHNNRTRRPAESVATARESARRAPIHETARTVRRRVNQEEVFA